MEKLFFFHFLSASFFLDAVVGRGTYDGSPCSKGPFQTLLIHNWQEKIFGMWGAPKYFTKELQAKNFFFKRIGRNLLVWHRHFTEILMEDGTINPSVESNDTPKPTRAAAKAAIEAIRKSHESPRARIKVARSGRKSQGERTYDHHVQAGVQRQRLQRTRKQAARFHDLYMLNKRAEKAKERAKELVEDLVTNGRRRAHLAKQAEEYDPMSRNMLFLKLQADLDEADIISYQERLVKESDSVHGSYVVQTVF